MADSWCCSNGKWVGGRGGLGDASGSNREQAGSEGSETVGGKGMGVGVLFCVMPRCPRLTCCDCWSLPPGSLKANMGVREGQGNKVLVTFRRGMRSDRLGLCLQTGAVLIVGLLIWTDCVCLCHDVYEVEESVTWPIEVCSNEV